MEVLQVAVRSCLPSPMYRQKASQLPKSSRTPPVSRVFKSPPRSKKRGELAWGGRLSRTAENSGPDPMPIKMNGKAPTSCGGTWQRAPPAQHIPRAAACTHTVRKPEAALATYVPPWGLVPWDKDVPSCWRGHPQALSLPESKHVGGIPQIF